MINGKHLPFEASSFGNDFGVPRGRVHRFLGKNFNEPCRGAENLRWDMTVNIGPYESIKNNMISPFVVCAVFPKYKKNKKISSKVVFAVADAIVNS